MRANASIQDIAGEMLVLEILSRSSSNRAALSSAKIDDLLLNWFKKQSQSFPDDEEMLLFDTSSSSNESNDRDDKWMRTTSVLLTILDHFNASYHPFTPQKGLEGMQRSELSSLCRIPCGVELARLLQRCKSKKGEEWRAMEIWIRRELAFTFSVESTYRLEEVKEVLNSCGELAWMERMMMTAGTPQEEYDDETLVYLLVEGADLQQ